MTDEEIVNGCSAEKKQFQEILYYKFNKKMFSVCLRYAKDRDQALDMLQEGFIKVFNHIKNFTFKGSLEGWIRRIMINTAINILRKEKFTIHIDDVNYHPSFEEKNTVIDQLSAAEIHKLIQKLPTGYRTVFNMFAVEGYSHKEIAQALEIQESTSRTQFLKAKNSLRILIENINKSTRNV